MKILTITSHISSNALPCFQRNKTGFGYMVHDIITSLAGKGNDVDVLVSWYRFNELKLDGARYLGCSFVKIIVHFFQCLPLKRLLSLRKKYPVSNGATLKLIYCWLLTGYYRSVIQKGNYDMVHIHGCGLNEDFWVQLCQLLGQKYVVTLHGLNSFNNTVTMEASGKCYERDFLHEVVQGKHHITVISSGIKKRILKAENQEDSKSIEVICNSFQLYASGDISDIICKYGIPANAKILLYIGNIGNNKNQRQLVEAFPLVDPTIRDQIYVLFIGRPSDELDLQNLIEETPYVNHLIYVGGVDKSQIADYYKAANATALLSFSEGFGLSLVEGMHFGLPCMMFTDMDAYTDLYDPDAVVGIDTRSNDAVARAIEILMGTKWDKERIIKLSKKFTPDTMAENYLRVFRSEINSNNH